MAALTWRDVTAPDYRGVQSSINSAADLLTKSTNGMSGALTQFGGQQALQQLAKYSDAQKLQADLQSGQFSTANASPEALAAIMNRPATLINDAFNTQNTAFRKEYNPLLLESQGIINNQSSYNLAQDKDSQNYLETVTRPNAEVDRTRTDALWNRNEDTRKLLDTAQVDINTRLTNGSLSTVNQGRELLKSLSGGPKEVTDFYTKQLSARFPDLVAAPIASPFSSGIGSFGSNTQAPGATGNVATSVQAPLNADMVGMLSSADTTAKLPTGMMASVLQQETGGKSDYITDPAKYHYPLNAEGQRIAPHTGKVSTAFGPYGILESTAKNPGFGVTPLKDKSLVEQTRFASEYLAARIKAAGGDVQKGLAGYGEGVDYSNSVINRLGADNVPTAQQLSNTNASTIALNSMAKLGANTPEVERWLAATATPGNGSLADVANELKKGSLNTVPMNRIQEMLQQVAAKTNTTGDARLAGEILKSSLAGNSTFRFGFGTDTFGFNPDFSDKLIAENIKKYNDRSKTSDSIQTGRALDQGSAALVETQKEIDALKAYRNAKKNELATGVYGVTQGDVIQADAAVQQALAKSVQIQEQIENFRPKAKSETKPVQATPAADIIAAQVTPKVTTLGTYSYAKQKAEAEAALKLKREQRKAEKDAAEEQERQDSLARERVIQKQNDYVREQIQLRKEKSKS